MESFPNSSQPTNAAKVQTSSLGLFRVLLYIEVIALGACVYVDRRARELTSEAYDLYWTKLDDHEFGRLSRDKIRNEYIGRSGIHLVGNERENIDFYSNKGIFYDYRMEIRYVHKSPVLAAGCVGLGATTWQIGVAPGILPLYAATENRDPGLAIHSVKSLSTLRFDLPIWEEFSLFELAGIILLLAMTVAIIMFALASMPRHWRRLREPIVQNNLDQFWVGGLALFQISLFNRILPFRGETYEWAQYLLLGTVFPIFILLTSRSRNLRAFFVVSLAFLVPYSIGWDYWIECLLLGTGQWLLLYKVVRGRARHEEGSKAMVLRWPQVAIGIAVMTIGWQVAIRWMWWSGFLKGMTNLGLFAVISLGAMALVATAFAGLCVPNPSAIGRISWLPMISALGVFIFLATRGCGTSEYFLHQSLHHWSVIVEPAELVRQGGWLTWDVPSQYGFLNTMLIAELPFSSVWQSVYVCNVFLVLVTACIVFWLLQSLRTGLIHYLFSILITIAAVFVISGHANFLSGHFPYPTAGPYRYFWCYILLAILVWDFDLACRSQNSTRSHWLGNLAWLAGTLWSAESAVFCTAIWAPAYFLLVLRQSVKVRLDAWSERSLEIARWLALPPLLLVVAVGAICVSYIIDLGHLPDPRCFAEYCIGLKHFAALMNPSGAVAVLLLAYIVIATTGMLCLGEAFPLRTLPLVVGTAASLWAVSSYFVGNSLEACTTMLAPQVVITFAIVLRVLDRLNDSGANGNWIRLIILPIFTVLIAMTFGHSLFDQRARDMALDFRVDMPQSLPDVDLALQQLLFESGATAETPLFVVYDLWPRPCWYAAGSPDRLSQTRYWLPGGASPLILPLSPERRNIYVSRFVARNRRSGYLIAARDASSKFQSRVLGADAKSAPEEERAWILEELMKTHVPGRTFSNDSWSMTWFEYRGD